MTTDCISQVPLEFYDNLKPVVARFDQAYAGGLVLCRTSCSRFWANQFRGAVPELLHTFVGRPFSSELTRRGFSLAHLGGFLEKRLGGRLGTMFSALSAGGKTLHHRTNHELLLRLRNVRYPACHREGTVRTHSGEMN